MNQHRSRRSGQGRGHWPAGAVLGLLAVAAGAVGFASGAAGCSGAPFIFNYNDCDNADRGHKDPLGNLDECHCYDDPEGALCVDSLCRHTAPSEEPLCARDAGGRDAADDGPPRGCTGQCLPIQPLGWAAPVQLWFGEEGGAPPCPEEAPVVGYEGHADLHAADPICGACSCAPPGGSCALPADITASAASCASTNALTPRTDFDPPESWDGTCTAQDAIGADKMCGSVKCVSSLTTAPLALSEDGCLASPQPVPEDLSPPSWGTLGRSCIGSVYGTCDSAGETCAPAAAEGFRTCIFHTGDMECPSFAPYSERHVFHADYDDARGCSACGCGTPAGSTCSATLSVYSDGACSVQIFSRIVHETDATCDDLKAGTPLGSKKLGPVTYEPGQCAVSGGEPTGTAEPVMPVTFCCVPAPAP